MRRIARKSTSEASPAPCVRPALYAAVAAQYQSTHAECDPLTLPRMASTEQSLVLGVVSTLPVELVEPFARSLRQTSYRGRLCIFADRMSSTDLNRLRLLADEVVVLDGRYPGVAGPPSRVVRGLSWLRETRRIRRVYPAMFRVAASLSAQAARRCELEYALEGLQALRYKHYLEYLEGPGASADRVLISDLRDVLFQRDPFAHEAHELELVLEADHVTIGAEPFNRRWVANLYGRHVLQQLATHVVSCSGTVLGTRKGMIRYLRHMVREIARHRRPLGSHDQAIHNWLLRIGALDPLHLHRNEFGPVITMGQQRTIRVVEGEVVNADGSVTPIVHQYDRHPHLLAGLRTANVPSTPAGSEVS